MKRILKSASKALHWQNNAAKRGSTALFFAKS
jgi:hypothetical protein